MKDFLTNIIKQIVENPDAVQVVETQDEGRINLQIKVADEDMGRVIGKEGKVINSIRMIMRVMAIRQNVRVRIDIEDNRPRTVVEEVETNEVVATPEAAPVAPVAQPETPAVAAPTAAPQQAATANELVGQPAASNTILDNSKS